MPGTVAITGASGYLGSLVSTVLGDLGWRVIRLVRTPGSGPDEVQYDLGLPATAVLKRALGSADALIHTAYDLKLTDRRRIWSTNVDGSRHLLDLASSLSIPKVFVLSSMSAYTGTIQTYGQAKLAIEDAAASVGACTLRPGLVCGYPPGGLAAKLTRLARMPITPVIAGHPTVYAVLDEDLVGLLSLLLQSGRRYPSIISAAYPVPVPLTDILRVFASWNGHSCRFLPLPQTITYQGIRTLEALRLPLPFRADSLMGLLHAAPGLAGSEVLAELGAQMRSPLSLTGPREASAPV